MGNAIKVWSLFLDVYHFMVVSPKLFSFHKKFSLQEMQSRCGPPFFAVQTYR